ncbi:DUF3592 domain-containing protein [Thermomonas carbonis]|uniref:DUF3592 domain-containing protein n=1 Tax=Thermomonas carbonis TaxID=1463158 RepID=A0A7G9SQI2_9GAMM|nr:DUF3592 domain-containing protein [Thermomonas carbonis]QNN70107.1 DUF3592 domain-containing protein [Thermomonas carbonis]
MTPIGPFAGLSMLAVTIPMWLIGIGLVAMLLPQAIIRRMAGSRDPVAMGMLPFATGLTLLGVLLAWVHAFDGARALQARDWQRLPAKIVRSDLREVMQPRSTKPAWRPDLAYEYRFSGHLHRGHRIAFRSLSSSDREGSRAWLQTQYPLGSEHDIHVNPASPQESVIERGGSPWTWMTFAAGLALAAAGLHLFRVAARDLRKSTTARRQSRP